MSQTSGVLIVGPTHSSALDFGADRVATLKEAREFLKDHHPSVVVFGADETEFESFCSYALENAPQALWIVCAENLKPARMVHWTNFGKLYALIDDLKDPELEITLRSALETADENRQRSNLRDLFGEQSLQLKRLSTELEGRVQKRHKTLRKSKVTLEETRTRLESFHKALVGIHRAATVLQMEQTLNEALQNSVNMVWVRVRFESQSLLRKQSAGNVLSVEIPFHEEKMRGEVMFSKADGGNFSSAEVDFLHELTEALALALSRLHKLEQAETVKAQWQATFDAIPHALCLTDGALEILKMNRAFQQACHGPEFRSLLGKNCFDVFFGDEFHPPANLETPFSFRNSRTGTKETEHFEIISETLGLTIDQMDVQLILLRSITEQVRFERRILEASKQAELGTIGSSIAHELNNPLGGMLSFLQLILMDTKKDNPIHAEIKEMESAVLRCRDIVINLLSFARKQDLGEFAPVDLNTVIERSVKLIELQSKSKGVALEIHAEPKAMVLGSVGALSQALCNLLQNSIDAISAKIKNEALFPGKMRVELEASGDQYLVRIHDNGEGIRPEDQSQIFNPLFTTRDPGHYHGMGLTTAFTIVSEHHGTLEILSQTGSSTTAIVSLPRLVKKG